MTSIEQLLDADDIVAEIRMERQAFNGAFILIEGSSDARRFEQFLDLDRASLVNCWGRSKLLIASGKLNSAGFTGFVALADADFDRVKGTLENIDNVIYSDNHDFEIDTVRTSAFAKYLKEVGNVTLCKDIGDHDVIRTRIAEALAPLSAAKFANILGVINYKLSEMNWLPCLADLQINKEKLAFTILRRESPDRERIAALVDIIDRHMPSDLWQSTNGHDFCAALGVSLRGTLADRKHPQTTPDEVEKHLRLALSEADFRNMGVYRSLRQWQSDNNIRLLTEHLC